MDKLAANKSLVLETAANVEAVRGNDERYRFSQDEAAQAEVKDHTRRARELLTEAASNSLSEESRRIYKDVKAALQVHDETFDGFVQLQSIVATERGKLFRGDDEVTAATSRLFESTDGLSGGQVAKVSRLRAAISLSRIASWRFLATGDRKGPATFKANVEKASAALADAEHDATPAMAALLKPIDVALTAYASAFEAISDAKIKSMDLYETQMRPQSFEAQAKLQPALVSLNAAYAASSAETQRIASTTSRLQLLLASAGLALGAILAFAIGRGITRPIKLMTVAMGRLARQDLEAEIPGVGRRDEIGVMAVAVQVFKDNALQACVLACEQAEAANRRAAEDERVRLDAEQTAASAAAALVVGSIGMGLHRLAGGDLMFRLNDALPEAYEQLRSDLNTAASALHDLVRNIVTNTSGIRSGTDEITQASDDLSRRTEHQAASLEQTAAALDQITATVRKTAEGAKQASDIVARTRTDAVQSGEVVRQAVAAMGSIERSSEQVGQIIGVIDEIAFQTNLLALNAGVEAARAGDAGRGFAVVASEVRALAQRSAQAAKEIKALISASAQQIGVGVKLVGETGQALVRIVSQVGEVTTAVCEIAASAREQAAGLAQVNTAINQMDQVTQQNAAMVEQSTAASHSLAQEAAELVSLTERFQIGAAPSGATGATSVQPMNRSAKPAKCAPKVAALKAVSKGGGAALRKPILAPELAGESWTEF